MSGWDQIREVTQQRIEQGDEEFDELIDVDPQDPPVDELGLTELIDAEEDRRIERAAAWKSFGLVAGMSLLALAVLVLLSVFFYPQMIM